MSLFLALVAVAALPLVGCSGKKVAPLSSEATAPTKKKAPVFKLRNDAEVAPGYEIELSSSQDEKLNGKFRIEFDGSLKLPYDTVVQTSGLTSKQLKEKVLAAYAKFYQSIPTMDVAVSERMYWVDVRGMVTKPGKYLVKADASVDELLSQAGGILSPPPPAVGPRYVRIQQLGTTTQVINLGDYYSGVPFSDPKWQGGDVVFVQRDRGEAVPVEDSLKYVKVLGQVATPGEAPFQEGADFYHYLVKAGGPTERAALYKVEIVRMEGGTRVSKFFSAEDEEILPSVQGGDVIIVHADNTTGFEKRTRAIAEIAGIITSFATVVILAVTL